MASMLSNEQGLALLKRLATDDAFRSAYSADPKSALASLGVDQATIDQLDEKCLAPVELADKTAFAALLANTEAKNMTAAMAMDVPRVSFR